MRKAIRLLSIAVLLVITGTVTALAATPKIEGTPAPTPPKPDFSTMQFLVGTWNCVDLSSRRPGPFNTTEVYTMDPSGYWMLRESTIHKASWIPRDFKSETKYTWDSVAKEWVRVVTGDQGGFSVATAPAPSGNKKIYTYVVQTKARDVATYAPEVFVKVSDTKKTMTTSFTETTGRIVNVKESCTKT